MEVNLRRAPNLGWIETKLDKDWMNFLWKMIAKRSGKNFKKNLAGNISKSYQIPDEEDLFFKNIIFQALFFILKR